MGTGYNAGLGNPLHTEKVDPGFASKIFSFTYNNQDKTEDGLYLIPDKVNEVKATSCSYNSEVSKHSGTESYQRKLSTKATLNGGYKGALVEASFSFSSTYEKIQNSTTTHNNTTTQAMAECERYKLSVNIFDPLPLTDNFKKGVEQSYANKNWDNFINQYGSHFTYEVIMGGRAIQQIEYSFESVSRLEELSIDINTAAKASYAKFYGDTSFDWKKY